MGYLSARLGDIKGSDKPNLWKIEQGQWPRPELLTAIARAFGLKVYQLVATAEGCDLPVAALSDEDRQLLEMYRLMHKEDRIAYLAVGASMVKHVR